MTEGAIEQRESRTAEALPLPRPARPLRLTASLPWRITQAAADFLTVVVAAGVSYWLYLASGLGLAHRDPALYRQIHLGLALVTVLALHGQGAYRGQFGLLRIETARRTLVAAAWGVAILLALTFFLKVPAFSRLSVIVLWPVVSVALIAQRFALWRVQERVRAASGRVAPVLVYGAGETGRTLVQHLMGDHALGLTPVGFLDDRSNLRGQQIKVGAGVRGARIPVLGGEEEMERLHRETGASAVILAMPSASSDRIAELVAKLESKGIPFFCVPSAGNLYFSTLRFGQLAGMPVFTRRRVEAERVYEAAKRAIDIAVSAAALLVTLPLLALAALVVRLGSRGPVFFRQDRIGKDGRPFTIFKLRTMLADSPAYAIHPQSDGDDRVTAVGRWLRRLSVDELPQLWNVLKGEMSLVGPRPEMPFLVAEYHDIERQRLTVKPGLTGLWQISADRAFQIHDNIQYDLYYVENRSLGLDLAILMLTPFVLLARERAR